MSIPTDDHDPPIEHEQAEGPGAGLTFLLMSARGSEVPPLLELIAALLAIRDTLRDVNTTLLAMRETLS